MPNQMKDIIECYEIARHETGDSAAAAILVLAHEVRALAKATASWPPLENTSEIPETIPLGYQPTVPDGRPRP